MTLGDKVRALRAVEGDLRGLGRPLTQQEVAEILARETGASISQSYLSQVESGARPHLTERTRLLLARFFKIHPGYLVSDPAGYQTELASELRADEGPLDEWLRQGAARFAADRDLQAALLRLARHDDSRRCLVLLGAIVSTPDLVDRLLDTLKPGLSPAPEEPAPGDGDGWLQ
jgi:transcriptional regulator with XRE-family HTH domain